MEVVGVRIYHLQGMDRRLDGSDIMKISSLPLTFKA
jgi:hypothetical protein